MKKAPFSQLKDEVEQSLQGKVFDTLLSLFLVILLSPFVLSTASACSLEVPPPQEEKTPATTNNNSSQTQQRQPLNKPCDAEHIPPDNYQWMQEFHETISNSVFQSAMWFDSFFLDENSEQETPKVTARIRVGWEPKSRDWGEFDTRFRIKVKLPHFKNKADLILSDEDDADQSLLPLEKNDINTDNDDNNFAAAVRYTHNKSTDKLLESRIGISGGDIFLKVKHKRRYNWQDRHSFKAEPSIYYFLDDGLGAKLLFEYDYQAKQQTQYRVNYSVRVSQSFSGLRWKHGFYRLKQLQQNAASITALQVQGERNGERGFIIDKYTLSYRYRFNALKTWLFFEVEPFLEWPEEENYTTTPGIAFRIEGFFSKG
ncbi:hypothetical protein [Thalassotalea sp. G2M2-11]|uniref:hypothetical protein n=1 Tax=Thalassotalea sp. G2M2-11 TaxID=2787627 RepID=UPI0019D30A7F|nr:hypothetical protein [Thalassotalea sp. G2M2-11]